MKKYTDRSSVEPEYKWDLQFLCKDNDSFNKRVKALENEIQKLASHKDCIKSAKSLKEYIELDIELSTELMDLGVYAMTLSDSDLSESLPVEMVGTINKLETLYSVETAFFEPALLSLTKQEYDKLASSEELTKYRPYLDKIYRKKEHILSASEEKIVSSLTETIGSYSNISSTLLNSNHDYGYVTMDDKTKEVLMSTNYRILMKKLKRDKRKKTYVQFNKVKSQYADVNASLLNNYVSSMNSLAKIYKFNSAWEEKLFGLNLSDKVFDALKSAAIKNKKVIEKYQKLKAKCLNVSHLEPWDAPMELYEMNKEYSIKEAQEICLKALEPLGKDYIEHFKKLITNRAVDYCQYKNKCSGGYNVSSIGQQNSLILMSYNWDLESVSTLIHEGGHYTHHSYIYENNEPIYRSQSSIVCEVASLTNECLLSSYLVKNGSREEALQGLSNLIGVFMSNFFGAIQEGDMERKFYEYSLNGGTLTKDYLNNLAKESILEFYPKKSLHPYEQCSWISRSHYYMFFYLFSYAICISVASTLADKILNGEEGILEKYSKFLKTGSDVWPKDAFKILGIDLEDEKVYTDACKYFDNLLNQFNNILERE